MPYKPTGPNVNANVKAEMRRQGIKQEDMALMLGVTERTVNNWLNGKRPIPGNYAVEMADLLNCTTDFILGRTGKQRPLSVAVTQEPEPDFPRALISDSATWDSTP